MRKVACTKVSYDPSTSITTSFEPTGISSANWSLTIDFNSSKSWVRIAYSPAITSKKFKGIQKDCECYIFPDAINSTALYSWGDMNGTYFDIRDIDEISKIATIHNSQIGAMNASIDFMAMALHMNSVTTVGLILDWKSVGRQWCKPVKVTRMAQLFTCYNPFKDFTLCVIPITKPVIEFIIWFAICKSAFNK